MRALWLFLGALLVAAGPARAADGNGEFFSRGLGIARCQDYLDDKAGNTEKYLYYRSWLNGYLTAYNQMTPDTFDIAPNIAIEGLANAVGKVCEAEPERPFWAAASAVTRVLQPQRLTAKPELLTVTAGQRSMTIDRPTLRRVQQTLKALGYEVGVVDGLYGRNTRLALEAYQQDEQLAVTGLPDPDTRARLLR